MMSDYQWCFENPRDAADLIEQQQQRIVELEYQLAEAKSLQSYSHHIAKLQTEKQELAATIYRLRDALQTHTAQPVCCGNVDIEYSPNGEPIGQQCCGWGDFEWPQDVVELLSATPQQNLNAVKREVAKRAFIAGFDHFDKCRRMGERFGNEGAAAEEYANTNYPSGEE